MTIAEFAERTGISASALRFYERKGLLLPADRLANGYRAYLRQQVPDARLVHSLRQAGIPIAEVRRYLAADAVEREGLLAAWRAAADARVLEAEIARSYLHAMGPEMPPIALLHWDEPSAFCWLPVRVARRRLPFRRAIRAGQRELASCGLPVREAGFVRSIDLEPDAIVGEVGFRLDTSRNWKLPPGARLERFAPQLLAAMECQVEQEKAAHRLFRVLEDFGFEPNGTHLERHLPGEAASYQVIVGIRRRVVSHPPGTSP